MPIVQSITSFENSGFRCVCEPCAWKRSVCLACSAVGAPARGRERQDFFAQLGGEHGALAGPGGADEGGGEAWRIVAGAGLRGRGVRQVCWRDPNIAVEGKLKTQRIGKIVSV